MLRRTSLLLVAGLCASCAQIIGLSDYKKVDGDESGGSATLQGGKKGSGGQGGANAAGGDDGLGGDTGDGGVSTNGGQPGAGGRPSGGKTGAGGAPSTSGGRIGVGGAPPASGGRVGTGGAPPASGGRVGAGGAPPASGGSVGTGGATPPTGGATCVPTTVDLLAGNGNFDGAAIPFGNTTSAVGSWYQGSTESLAVVQSTAELAPFNIAPQSGTRAAHLGEIGDTVFQNGDIGRESWVGKVVTIPATATAITASCYTAINSDDATSGDPTVDDDFLQVWFWDPANDDYAYIFALASEFNAPRPWSAWDNSPTPAEVAILAGHTLAFELYSFVNNAARTDFYLDSCSLKVTYCK